MITEKRTKRSKSLKLQQRKMISDAFKNRRQPQQTQPRQQLQGGSSGSAGGHQATMSRARNASSSCSNSFTLTSSNTTWCPRSKQLACILYSGLKLPEHLREQTALDEDGENNNGGGREGDDIDENGPSSGLPPPPLDPLKATKVPDFSNVVVNWLKEAVEPKLETRVKSSSTTAATLRAAAPSLSLQSSATTHSSTTMEGNFIASVAFASHISEYFSSPELGERALKSLASSLGFSVPYLLEDSTTNTLLSLSPIFRGDEEGANQNEEHQGTTTRDESIPDSMHRIRLYMVAAFFLGTYQDEEEESVNDEHGGETHTQGLMLQDLYSALSSKEQTMVLAATHQLLSL